MKSPLYLFQVNFKRYYLKKNNDPVKHERTLTTRSMGNYRVLCNNLIGMILQVRISFSLFLVRNHQIMDDKHLNSANNLMTNYPSIEVVAFFCEK